LANAMTTSSRARTHGKSAEMSCASPSASSERRCARRCRRGMRWHSSSARPEPQKHSERGMRRP
jgi:hypothetical protein